MTVPAPYPWFGGKRRVAAEVWRRLGDVPNYIEPFFGSGAVLLARPHEPSYETINDLDCDVANFWRAVKAAPELVAEAADWPVIETELHARHHTLIAATEEHRARLDRDPSYFDARRAGWWAWGVSASVGNNFLRTKGDNAMVNLTPRGVIPNPSFSHDRGVHSRTKPELGEWMRMLSERLRRVRVACGDWSRVVTGAVLGTSLKQGSNGMTPCGVFLDPPYVGEEELYREGNEVAAAVREWAIANGDDKRLRIALCGYEGTVEMPSTWSVHAWKAQGGYGNRRGEEANENARRERIWFSPHCMPETAVQAALFG
jgi:DNA adenine methylase